MDISPTDVQVPPGGEYTLAVTLPDKGEVTGPEFTTTVSGANAEVVAAYSVRSGGFSSADKVDTSTDPTFIKYSTDRILTYDTIFLTISVPDSASIGETISVVSNYQGDESPTLPGGEFDLTESVNPEVRGLSSSMSLMAPQADQRATIAEKYLESYKNVENNEAVFNDILYQTLISGFTTAGIEIAKSYVSGPIGVALDAKEAYDTIIGGGGAVDETFSILDSFIDEISSFDNTVTNYGKTGDSLAQLAEHQRSEAQAWRDNNRTGVIDALESQERITYLCGSNYDDLCVRGQAKKEQSYITDSESLMRYYDGVMSYAIEDYNHITDQLLPVARRPDVTVGTNASHSTIGSNLDSLGVGEQTTVEFTVENSGGVSDNGYLTVSHASSLEIVNIEQTSGDTGEAFDRSDFDPGDTINSKNGTKAADYPLTDLVESYRSGETNTYAYTFERVGDSDAWFTYRVAHRPVLQENPSDPTYERSPTGGDQDQQGWYAHRVEQKQPAQFDVSIDDVNDPVVEGGTLTITATMTNNGEISGSDTLHIDVDGNQVCSYQESVSPGESVTWQCGYTTSVGDEPSVSITADTSDDSDSYTASVDPALDEAYFDISIDSVNDPVTEGETLTVDVSVTNTGDMSDSQNLRLIVNGSRVDSSAVSLNGDESKTRTLSYSTQVGDSSTVTVEVNSDGSGNEVIYEASVREQPDSPYFDIVVDSANDPVVEGDILTLQISVKNTGGQSGTQTLRLNVNNETVDSRQISISVGETKTAELSYATETGDYPSVSLEVDSDSDGTTVSYDAVVQESTDPFYQIEITEINGPVFEEDVLTVSLQITNTGTESGTQTISLSIEDSSRDSKVVELDGESSTTTSLEYPTVIGDAPSIEITVDSDGAGNGDASIAYVNEANRVEWTAETNGQVVSSPTVVNDKVFVMDETGMCVLDATTGGKNWYFTGVSEMQSSPTVVDDTIYVNGRGRLVAIDIDSRNKLWDANVGRPTYNPINQSATITGDSVYAQTTPGFTSFDRESGSVNWRQNVYTTSSPTVAQNLVLVGCQNGALYAYNRISGDAKWRFSTNGVIRSSPTVSGGNVYVGSLDNNVYSLDLDSGKKEWEFETGGSIWSSPTATSRTVYIGSNDGNLYALEATSGEERWSFQANGSIRSSPTVIENNTVYVGDSAGHVYALNAATGNVIWSFKTTDVIWSSPIVVDGVLFIGSDKIYALNVDVSGRSTGSRVGLGTLGHHSKWSNIATQYHPAIAAKDQLALQGAEVKIPIKAEATESVRIGDLWSDWEIVDGGSTSESFNNEVAESGSCRYNWENAEVAVSPELQISLPERYIGGEYGLYLSAIQSEMTADTKASIQIVDPLKTIAFKGGSAGEKTVDPWSVYAEHTESTIEIRDNRSLLGGQSQYMHAGIITEPVQIGAEIDTTNINHMCVSIFSGWDPSWGEHQVRLSSGDLNSTMSATLNTWEENTVDMSSFVGRDTLLLHISSYNKIYWDNIRFFDDNSDKLPLSSVLVE